MLNIGLGDLLVLAIIGLVVIGPDKLPGFARDAARILRTLRELARSAKADISKELGPDLAHKLGDLDPRTALSRLMDEDPTEPVREPAIAGSRPRPRPYPTPEHEDA